MQLYVRNDALHDGYLHSVHIHGPDGALFAELRNLNDRLPAQTANYVPLGKVPRVRPKAAPGEEGEHPTITWTVEFSDAAGLVRWRQQGENDELVNFQQGSTGPVASYLYSEGYRRAPTPVEVEPGVLQQRRWWRRP